MSEADADFEDRVWEALVAWSEGRITRRDFSDVVGREVSFGEMLMAVGIADLPLPVHRHPPDYRGRVLLANTIRAERDARP